MKKLIRLFSFIILFSALALTSCGSGGSGSETTPLTDTQAVTTDAEALDPEDITFTGGDAPSNVTDDFTLPTGGENGTTITWAEKSDPGGCVVLSGTGNSSAAVTNSPWPEDDGFSKTVVLTATITKGTETETKDISIYVTPPATTKISTTADSVTFKMVLVPGGLTFPTGTSDNGTATVANSYWIGETEVTYELWDKVYTWATDPARGDNQYYFANTGREGNDGKDGEDPTLAKNEPVTNINWRDSMVWCNALTEWYNAQKGTNYECVYTYSSGIIRDSSDSNATACDSAVAISTSKGFRLLTRNEYELAARYRGSDTTNVVTGTIGGVDFDIMTIKWTKGNSASGATTYYNDNSSGSGEPAKSTNDAVAVYHDYWNGTSWVPTGVTSTLAVKSRNANTLGLYNISGNVRQWCFDSNGSLRMLPVGSWFNNAEYMRVGYFASSNPDNKNIITGLRIAMSQ